MCKLTIAWITPLLVTLSCAASFAQQIGSTPVINPGRRGSMQVLEFGAATQASAPLNYFTVVGAVETSAVFTSSQASLPLSELMAAAGGFSRNATGAVRILNNGRPRTQLLYGNEDPLPVFPNEIVVVVPADPDPLKPAAPQSAPVVCLGLDNRPVVLPLAERVQSLPALLHQLAQPQSMLGRVQVLTPSGRPSRGELVAGTVLFFDPAALDQNGLRWVRSQEDFNPAMSFEQARLPKITPASPSTSPAEAPKGALVTPGIPNEPLAAIQVPQLPEPLRISEAPPVPPQAEAVPLANTLQREPTLAPPPPMEPLPEPFVGELKALPATSPPPQATAERASWIYSDDSSTSPAKDLSRPQNSEPEPTLADSPFDSLESDRAAEETSSATKNMTGPIAFGLIALSVASAGACWFWLKSQRDSVSRAIPLAAVTPPMPTSAAEQRSTLEQLLDPATPVIEVQLQPPSPSVLHGELIGHRHLQVHASHAELQGPHFAKPANAPGRSQNSKHEELTLRHSLREVIAGHRAKMPAAPKFVVKPPGTGAAASDAYDVVQPEPIDPRRAGTLERALRTSIVHTARKTLQTREPRR